MLGDAHNLSMIDRERLFGFLEGRRKLILPEPQALLTAASRLPRLDGQKMSKSYDNAIRSGAPMPAIPTSARYGNSTWCIPTMQSEPGLTMATAAPASVVWSASNR